MSAMHASTSRNTHDQAPSRADVYTRVTDQIIKAIEAGAGEFKMPWHSNPVASGIPINAATGKAYRGANVIALWAQAEDKGYPEGTWATFRQWSELGHSVRRGEKATLGIFWKPLDIDDADQAKDESGESDEDSVRWIARGFSVFNAAQVEGYEPPPRPVRPDHERIAHAEAFISALGADIRHGGNRAFYRPSTDHIQMPHFDAFHNPIAYYSTLAHEAGHWTGHTSRLNRDLQGRFGSEKYAAEELVAELSAAFIAADLGLAPEPKQENAAYIQSWLKILKADSRAIFTASSHAQRAADYLHGLQSTVAPQAVTSPPTTPAPASAIQQSFCF